MFALVIFGYISCIILFLFFVFMVTFYDWKWVKDRYRYAQIPTPKWHFIVGAGLDLLRCKDDELFDLLDRKRKEINSDVMLLPILGRTNVLLFSPGDIEEVFKSFEYLKKGYEYNFLRPWFRNNVIMKSGDEWLKKRKFLSPAFHNIVLQNYVPAINKHAKLLTKVLAEQSRSKGCINVEDYIMKITMDIAMETLLGVELNCLQGETPEYIIDLKRAGDMVLKRNLNFWMHNDMLFGISPLGRDFYRTVKRIHDFYGQVVNNRKQFHANYEMQGYTLIKDIAKLRKSFLDYLLIVQSENPTELTDVDVVDDIQSVFFAGSESIGLVLTYTIFMLAVHPEVQEKLRQEIKNVFGDSDREVTVEDIHQLNYTEMVILESVRIYPVFPIISRGLDTDLKLKKYTIPAGANIIVIPYFTHRDPNSFPDPEKFDPDRFLPEAIQARHNYSYLGWSAGYRSCMGRKLATWEMKIILATIFRSLTVSTNMKQEDLIVSPQVELKPVTHVNVTFTPISI